MPQTVKVEYKNLTIYIHSLDHPDRPVTSLDLSPATYSEMGGWSGEMISGIVAKLNLAGQEHVNCMQGQNRSPTAAILYLWSVGGGTLQEAFNAVKEAYRDAGATFGEAKIQGLLEQALGAYVPVPAGRATRSGTSWDKTLQLTYASLAKNPPFTTT